MKDKRENHLCEILFPTQQTSSRGQINCVIKAVQSLRRNICILKPHRFLRPSLESGHTDIIPHSVLNAKKCWQDLHYPRSVLRARENVLPLNRLSSMQYCIHCSYQNDPLAYEPPQPLQDYPVVIVDVLLVYLSPNSRGHHIQMKRQRNLFT